MTAKEFYNKKAFKHQLKRALKHDKKYFEDCIIEMMEQYAQEQVKNITYEPLLGTGLCENCRVPKMTNSGNGVDEPTNPVLWCHKESLIIEPVPEREQTAECAGFEPCA